MGADNRTVSVGKHRTEAGLINNSADAIQFEFDNILRDASQEEVFTQCGAEACEAVLSGYNATVFAYGQTGAGKTFTMSGDTSSDYKQRGIIPRAVHHVFREMDVRVEKEMTVRCSYLEIYNECIFDLLAERVDPDGPELVVVDRDGQTVVKHLTQRVASNESEALAFFFEGEANRAVSDHVLNKTSSRSHCVFTLHVECRATGDGDDRTTVSKLHLVDLAGSERVKKTEVTGQQLKEANFINKSLTFLEQTVNALSRGDAHVAFRQSKLTSVLRDALGGNCKTVMIACAWPDDAHSDETISTCRFASRVMTLQTRAVVNESKDPRVLLRKYERHVAELKRELAMANTLAERAPVNYGPMGEVERQELDEKVRGYLEAENASADDVPTESLRQIREAFRLFKAAYVEMRAELNDRVVKADAAALAAEASRQSLGAADGEGAQEGADAEGAQEGAEAEGADGAGAQEGADGEGDEVGDAEAETTGFAAGVAPDDAAPPPDTPARAEADVAMTRAAADARRAANARVESEERNAAFAEYKRSVNPTRGEAAAVAAAELRAAKAALRDKVEAVNKTKAEIDALTKKVEAMRAAAAENEPENADPDAPETVDEETYEAMTKLKRAKAAYRNAFEEVKDLKSAVEPKAGAARAARAALAAEFQEWYEKGGGMDLRVARDAEEDDMDYGEKFDQLELQRVLNRDPDGGAFFAAKKERRRSHRAHPPISREKQHMRAVGFGTPRRPF